MVDLISRRAVNDLLDELARAISDERCGCPRGRSIGTIMRDILHLPSAEFWISCSKMMPEKKGHYITTTIYGEVYCDFWNGINFDRQEKVIAWMRLPEPYRGEE